LKYMKPSSVCVIVLLTLLFSSCKKETFITSKDALLSISTDTLHFDTVFTSVGSITQSFKIKNDNNQKLRLSGVKLMGGATSVYKINVNGSIGPDVEDIEVDANDSIYVFVSVNINPTLANLPFIIADSIQVGFNGNTRFVQLQAWGQNANFLRNRKIVGNVVWTNKLPYVILGGLQVDTSATLTIEKGCKIYLHADAPFLVDGTLKVNGEKYDSTRVYFKGDRLDVPYNGYPGSWPGIYFRGQSKDNVLQFAIVQNAFQGIVSELPSLNANPKLTLNECIIDNMYDAGILGIQSSITARNCLVSNCGATKETNGNITLAFGGNYSFTHCTAVGISNTFVPHVHPVLAVSNFIKQNNVDYTADLTANFTNCIFWGDSLQDGNEVIIEKRGSNNIFTVNVNNCLWRQKSPPSSTLVNTNFITNVQGEGADTSIFSGVNREKRIYNFRLKDNSPALNKGINTVIAFDLDGNSRTVGLPDLGSYEKQ
jgi:hypothetical protein